MNRLQLCVRAHTEMGLGGDGPSATTSQTGEALQVVNWVDDAWNKIQQSRNWDWLWEATTVTILATTNVTAGSIPASRYIKDAATDSSGGHYVYLPWAEFRLAFPTATIPTGTPGYWSIRPDKGFVVNAKPASDLTINVERYKNPTTMSADVDSPTGLPTEHHMLIVWRAVMLYAGHDEASALYQHANSEYRRVLAAMGATDCESIAWGAEW